MPNLTLTAPLRGWCGSLDEAPDAVFAERLLGDGVAIDPTGDTLFAPCDGSVTYIASSRHAVAIRAVNDAEILLHVGIDTVALNGSGFRLLVEPGARVHAGDPLLRFDLDLLARGASSLLTPVIVTNGDRFTVVAAHCGRSVEVGDALLEVESSATHTADTATANGKEMTEHLVVAFEHGIHARPAALIAGCASSIPTEITVAARGRRANARSPTALMSLGVRRGDELTLSARDAQAATAVRELKQRILELPDGLPQVSHGSPDRAPSEEIAIGRSLPQTDRRQPARSPLPEQDDRLRGVIASRGFAVGQAVALAQRDIPVNEAGSGIAHESAALDQARAEVAGRLDRLAQSAGSTAREVVAAHLALLDDPELIAAARRPISRGKSAAFAWRQAVRDSADTLRALDDPRMTERIDDLLDLEAQVLLALGGEAPASVGDLPERAILIAADLTPSQLVSLDTANLAGICTAAGGATSHVAILAAAMGVPALAALGPTLLQIEDGSGLVLDAERGELHIAPGPDALAAAERHLALRQQREQAEHAAAHADCCTADGARIEVLANLSSVAEAATAVASGAEGCGLLRSEFLFLERDEPPEEDEQAEHYQRIARALNGRPLVVRTLDVGGDKPIPYLPLPVEPNPALGLRGLRTSLWRPDLLRVQLRAILRVEPPDRCRVLVPMITDPSEVRAVRALVEEVRLELGRQEPVLLGVMIETPASALLAGQVAAAADFLSIGTNDLTQYTLAMDRDHAELAHRADGLHPAVLRLVAMTVEGARQHGRGVCVCGGLASDPDAVAVLIGLGVTELSVVPAVVPQIKSLIRALRIDDCRSLAAHALTLETAAEVRQLVAVDPSASESRVVP